MTSHLAKNLTQKCFLLLAQDCLALAIYEATSLLAIKEYRVLNHMLIADIALEKLSLVKRLAYTKQCYLFCSESTIADFESLLSTSSLIEDTIVPSFSLVSSQLPSEVSSITTPAVNHTATFVVRFHVLTGDTSLKSSLEKTAARLIGSKLLAKDFSVKLRDAALQIHLFQIEHSVFIGTLYYNNTDMFQTRRAHLRPALLPTAMHPKLARAIINCVARENIIDPFCGSGGILIEAGLMGVTFHGYDIDAHALAVAQKNLSYFNLPLHVSLGDALQLDSLSNVVSDLPYGKSSKLSDDMLVLYAKFIEKLTSRAVIVFPHFVDFESLLKKHLPAHLRVDKIISYYVHKSLTRMIVSIREK